jgi:hypothetical protein
VAAATLKQVQWKFLLLLAVCFLSIQSCAAALEQTVGLGEVFERLLE